MEKKISFSEILKKYTMVLVLVLVVIMFAVNTKGVMLLPQNVNNLVAQNAYVFILATGMLFCILTGGNIDLSVGSVVCFVAAVGGKMMVLNSMNPYLTMLVMLLTGIAIGDPSLETLLKSQNQSSSSSIVDLYIDDDEIDELDD